MALSECDPLRHFISDDDRLAEKADTKRPEPGLSPSAATMSARHSNADIRYLAQWAKGDGNRCPHRSTSRRAGEEGRKASTLARS